MLLAPTAARADWVDVIDFPQSFALVETERCEFRLHYLDTHNDVHRDHYFYPSKLLEFRNGAGEVYSQSFDFPISTSELGFLYFGGAMQQQYYSEISDRYQNDPKTPYDLHIGLIWNSSITQLAVAYKFFNESYGGQLYSSTVMLDKELFKLQALCPEAPAEPQPEAGPVPVQSVVASSSYSSSYGPDRIIDGQEATYWIGATNQPYYEVTFDLGQARNLESVQLSWYSEAYAGCDFDIQYSSDGVTFNTMAYDLCAEAEVAVDPSQSARYVRVGIYELPGPFPVLREISFIGW